jgi:hypothetical protein
LFPYKDISIQLEIVSDNEMTQSTQNWITTAEAVELTDYVVEYIRCLVRKGRIYALKRGRDWWVDLESLLAYKAQMDALGNQRHNPWREDLADQKRGRRSRER